MILVILLGLSTLITIGLMIRSRKAVTILKQPGAPAINQELPTVSVCIAARNETHALAQSMERVLHSDYPKLEVLVLDDSSSDDTSLIIKSFANAGVRFIPGAELPAGWLGKNHAYDTLLKEASGDIILYLDVDTLITVTTITQLVNSMRSKKLSMMTVVPRRSDSGHFSAYFNTLRYLWELLLNDRHHPAAVSALWMVDKSALKTASTSIADFKSSVRPERHIAKILNQTSEYLSFVAPKALGVTFEKRMHSQWETAERLYYPMVGKSLFGWLVSSIVLLLLLAPFVLVFAPLNDQLRLSAGLTSLLIITALTIITHRLHSPVLWRVRAVLWPVLLVQELILLQYSFYSYVTKSVTWKGRKVLSQPHLHDELRINE